MMSEFIQSWLESLRLLKPASLWQMTQRGMRAILMVVKQPVFWGMLMVPPIVGIFLAQFVGGRMSIWLFSWTPFWAPVILLFFVKSAIEEQNMQYEVKKLPLLLVVLGVCTAVLTYLHALVLSPWYHLAVIVSFVVLIIWILCMLDAPLTEYLWTIPQAFKLFVYRWPFFVGATILLYFLFYLLVILTVISPFLIRYIPGAQVPIFFTVLNLLFIGIQIVLIVTCILTIALYFAICVQGYKWFTQKDNIKLSER